MRIRWKEFDGKMATAKLTAKHEICDMWPSQDMIYIYDKR